MKLPFIAITAALIVCSISQAVNYRVTFDATWSAENHPDAYPGRNAHFSTPIGTTHNANVSFWAPSGLASPGIEGVAETGSIRVMQNEIGAAIDAGNAFGFIQGSTFNSPGIDHAGFEVLPDFPLVSLVSMIAPSPDWLVGVHDLDLRDEDGWISQVVVPLAPYDAGTEDGNAFNTGNAASNPIEAIRRLDTDATSLLFEAKPFGTFTFDLLPICDINADGSCNADDLNSQTGLYSAGDLTTEIPVTPGENSRFDMNADQVINSLDLVAWLADAAQQNGFAAPYLQGDTNLNDHVGFGDFLALSTGFGVGREWTEGNYDGNLNTDFADFLTLSANFGKSIPRQSQAATVPEPAGQVLVLAAWVLLYTARIRR